MALFIIPSAVAVDFEELDGSPTEVIYAGKTGTSVVTRKLRCKATDRGRLIIEFLGWTEYSGGNTIIHRPHSYWTPAGYLIAFSADTEPRGRITGSLGDDRFADYELSQVIIKYGEHPITDVLYGGLVKWRETLTSASEFTTFPHENLYWGTGGGKVPLDVLDAPTHLTVMLEWIIEVSDVLTLPVIPNYLGKINSNIEYSRSGFTFAAGTLLCSGAETVQHTELGLVGYTTKYDMTLRFLYRPLGWNYFPRPSEGGTTVNWERITDGTNNKNFYVAVDFSGLIFLPS